MAKCHKKSDRFDWGNVKPQLPINFGVDSNGERFHRPTETDRLIEKIEDVVRTGWIGEETDRARRGAPD